MKPKTYKINVDGNRCVPSGTHAVPADRISVKDCTVYPKLWVIGAEYGVLCAVFAECEQDAFDVAADLEWLQGIKVDDDAEEQEHYVPLGNYGERHDLTYAWIARAPALQPIETALALEHAIGAERGNVDTLADATVTFIAMKASQP